MHYLNSTIEELYRCYSILNEKFFNSELEEPIITIQKARVLNNGHFSCGKIWKSKNDNSEKYEINLAAHSLHREPHLIIGTLLHEMIHQYHMVNSINLQFAK